MGETALTLSAQTQLERFDAKNLLGVLIENVDEAGVIDRLASDPHFGNIVEGARRVNREAFDRVIGDVLSFLRAGRNPAVVSITGEIAEAAAAESLEGFFTENRQSIREVLVLATGVEFLIGCLNGIASPESQSSLLETMSNGELFGLASSISRAHEALPAVVATLLQRFLKEASAECSSVETNSTKLDHFNFISRPEDADYVQFTVTFNTAAPDLHKSEAIVEFGRLINIKLKDAGFRVTKCEKDGGIGQNLNVEVALPKKTTR